MAWRGLHISRPTSLRLKHRRLEVDQGEGALEFPLEDLAWVILETPQATATTALLAACMEAGVPIVVCDDRHMPCGTLLPFHQHHRQAEIAHLQIGASAALSKRLWQIVVQKKILNQADALRTRDGAAAEVIRRMAQHTRSGDPTNVEARAARYYWGRLFVDFRRENVSDRRNAMLNYGYAVLRAGIARSLVAHGLLPAFGFHHRSIQNAFNLADDIIEPYRPLVDGAVLASCFALDGEGKTGELTLNDRQGMAAILSADTLIEHEQVSVLAAIDKTVASLVRALATADIGELCLPNLLASAHANG